MILKSEGNKYQWSYALSINHSIYWGVEHCSNCVQSNEFLFFVFGQKTVLTFTTGNI